MRSFVGLFPIVLLVPLMSLGLAPPQSADPSFRIQAIDAVQSETAAVADLNNDRRLDIISAESWYEAPSWTKHPLRAINRASGYVDDFSDLRPDILTTMGHSCGVLWLEQGVDGGWTRHVIDDAWSAAHASTLADLNGDGRLDLVTGKRAQIHSDAVAAERDRLGMYWYDLSPPKAGSTTAWTRHVIDEGGKMGGGLQIVAIDIDGDGDLDVVASGKTGLYLAENLAKSPPIRGR